MPTDLETGLADGLVCCCAWNAEECKGTAEFGGSYTAVHVECGTHYARFRNTKKR